MPPVAAGLTIPDDALVVVWGSNVSWSTTLPHTVLRMASLDMLAVDRHPRRRRELVVTMLRIFDDTHSSARANLMIAASTVVVVVAIGYSAMAHG